MKYRYVDMITEAIFTLAEPKGATRDGIWKFISTSRKFKESTAGGKKQFLLQLKRCTMDHKYIEHSKSNATRFKLTRSYLDKLKRKLAKGEEFDLARKHAMVTKDNNPKKSRAKNTKAKASKAGAKGQQKLTKMKKQESKTKRRQAAGKTKKDAGKSKKNDAKAGAKTKKQDGAKAEQRGRSRSKDAYKENKKPGRKSSASAKSRGASTNKNKKTSEAKSRGRPSKSPTRRQS